MAESLKGTAASAGIGIGSVFVLEEADLSYTPHTVADPEAEILRFRGAVNEFIRETEEKAKALAGSASEKEAGIMLGHAAMIGDPYMRGEIEKLISAGQCAESAAESVCDMFIAMFSSVDDEMTRQRAADVRDVKHGLLALLLGVKELRVSDAPAGTVLVAKELTPSVTAGIKKENVVAIVTQTGGKTSHSAILARALEIPAVLSVEGGTDRFKNGDVLIVDGSAGAVFADPDAAQLEEYAAKREAYLEEKRELEGFRGKKTLSADGVEYELVCNIGKPDGAAETVERDGEGVGLFRTEFLFMDRTAVPSEDEQFEAYKKAAVILKGKPLIIRTLDIGGDKEIPYLGLEKEENPFMGFRAIRFCLKNRELFKSQLRAVLRASEFGDVRIMFPLITCVEEVREGKKLVEECKAELRAAGIACRDVPVGIMVETAAAAVLADVLAKESDFFSIGTNDLTGYTMSCDRGNADVSYLYSVFQPSVLRMIRRTVRSAREAGIPVGMCGEAAADPLLIPLLMAFGLTEFSVSPTSVLRTRQTVARWDLTSAKALADRAMALESEAEIVSLLKSAL